jgi:hypothetical protein
MSLCMPKNQTVRILIVADGLIEPGLQRGSSYTLID